MFILFRHKDIFMVKLFTTNLLFHQKGIRNRVKKKGAKTVMVNIKISNNNHKIKIEALSKECEITLQLSLSDFQTVKQWTRRSLSSADYRNFTAIIISHHTENMFSEDEISKLDDSVLLKIIEFFVEENEELKEKYSEQEIDSPFEYFIKSVQQVAENHASTVVSA